MSKYQVDASKVRKDEIDAHPSSFQYDKQYSYSRASQQGSKILDNVNKAQKNQDKSNDKNILDLIDGSFNDADLLQDNNNNQNQGNISNVKQEDEDKNNILVDEHIQNNEIQNNETQMNNNQPNLKASQKLTQFFMKSPEVVSQKSKSSLQQFWNSLSKKDNEEKKQSELIPSQVKVEDDEDKIIDENEFEMEDQYFMQDGSQKNLTQKKKQEGGKLGNQQDFGNISEIQDKRNLRENNDETAQDDELSALLNDPNKKKQKQGNNNNSIGENQEDDEDKKRNSTMSLKNQNHNQSQNLSQEGNEQNMRNSNVSASPNPHMNNSVLAEEKRKKIEEAQRKKRELEQELQAIQGEIAQINQNEEEKKKKKENKFLKYSEISEDRDAQENALQLIRKMNQARKEKELKLQKEREMFNKLLQEDIKESHERQIKLKEKVNNEKKERIQSKIESMRIRSEERKVINKQSNLIIKDIKRDLQINDPEERYKQDVELPELEKRKKELAEKRKLYKPIDMEEIREHAKKHDEDIKIRKLQAKANVLAEYNNIESGVEGGYKFPKTNALNKVLEEDKLYKMKDILEMQKKKEQIERRKEYAKLVKEVHVPRVKVRNQFSNDAENNNQQNYDIDSQSNYNNQQQVQSLNQIRTPNNYNRQQPVFRVKRNTAAGEGFSSSNQNLSPKPNQQAKVYRMHINPNKNNNNSSSQGRVIGKDNLSNQDQNYDLYNRTEELSSGQKGSLYNPGGYEDNVENINMESNKGFSQAGKSSYSANSVPKPIKHKAFKPATIEEPPKPAQKKYQNDYIQELRKQREDQEKKAGKKAKLEDWEKYKYDPSLSTNEKYKFILQSATRLEHNARLKELRNNNAYDLEAQEQANNLYIDSIKAKLSLLDNMN